MHSNEIEQTTLPQKIANKANIFEVAEWANGEMEFLFLCSGQYLICERSEWVRYRAEHEKRIPYLEETMYYFVYYTNTILTRKSRDGDVVEVLPFPPPHQCALGSISRSSVICGLSLFVLYSAPRGFLWVLRFSLPSKTSIWLDLC